MSRGESTIGRLACICRLTSVMSSCDDNADMNDDDEIEGVSEDESCESSG